jgi:hypothetical protein
MSSLLQLCHVMSGARCSSIACVQMDYTGGSGKGNIRMDLSGLFCWPCLEALIYRESVAIHRLEWIDARTTKEWQESGKFTRTVSY